MKKTVSFSRDAANVFFHITTRCNLNCRHCYINSDQHGNETLPLHVVERWLELFRHRAGEANLVLLGGEPTLHPDLAAIVRLARKLAYSSITIDTNGYLFHDILANVDPVDIDVISFSLDGATAETNDRIRGAGAFDTCTKGICRARAAGFDTSVIFTVSRANIYELQLMGPLLQSLEVNRFFIQVIGIRGRSASHRSEDLQVGKKEWLEDTCGGLDRVGANDSFECAGKVAHNYFIFPNGRVYRCPLCEDYPIHSLEIVENRLVERSPINENNLFQLDIPEGCVMNRLIQPENLSYRYDGTPEHAIACCLLKEEISHK